eukprot:scaffold295599_cov45-Prasinocladus_malaysianus.AAC.1
MWTDFLDSFVTYVHSNGLATAPTPPETSRRLPPLAVPPAERLVAIGDIHGDLEKCLRAFRLGGLTDSDHRWIGGTTVVVQVGRPVSLCFRRSDHRPGDKTSNYFVIYV